MSVVGKTVSVAWDFTKFVGKTAVKGADVGVAVGGTILAGNYIGKKIPTGIKEDAKYNAKKYFNYISDQKDFAGFLRGFLLMIMDMVTAGAPTEIREKLSKSFGIDLNNFAKRSDELNYDPNVVYEQMPKKYNLYQEALKNPGQVDIENKDFKTYFTYLSLSENSNEKADFYQKLTDIAIRDSNAEMYEYHKSMSKEIADDILKDLKQRDMMFKTDPVMASQCLEKTLGMVKNLSIDLGAGISQDEYSEYNLLIKRKFFTSESAKEYDILKDRIYNENLKYINEHPETLENKRKELDNIKITLEALHQNENIGYEDRKYLEMLIKNVNDKKDNLTAESLSREMTVESMFNIVTGEGIYPRITSDVDMTYSVQDPENIFNLKVYINEEHLKDSDISLIKNKIARNAENVKKDVDSIKDIINDPSNLLDKNNPNTTVEEAKELANLVKELNENGIFVKGLNLDSDNFEKQYIKLSDEAKSEVKSKLDNVDKIEKANSGYKSYIHYIDYGTKSYYPTSEENIRKYNISFGKDARMKAIENLPDNLKEIKYCIGLILNSLSKKDTDELKKEFLDKNGKFKAFSIGMDKETYKKNQEMQNVINGGIGNIKGVLFASMDEKEFNVSPYKKWLDDFIGNLNNFFENNSGDLENIIEKATNKFNDMSNNMSSSENSDINNKVEEELENLSQQFSNMF